MVFSDQSCPGTANRQAIRQCFESAMGAGGGEPTCAELQARQACFLDKGCCHDWEATLAEWVKSFPGLASCDFGSGCPVFGDDNVVSVTVRVSESLASFTPDRQAAFRGVVAQQAGVATARVRIVSVTAVAATARRAGEAVDVVTEISAASSDAAVTLLSSLDTSALSTALATALGVQVSSSEPVHETPPPPPPPLWETVDYVGVALGCVGVVVLGLALCYLEEVACKPSGHRVQPNDDAKDGDAKDLEAPSQIAGQSFGAVGRSASPEIHTVPNGP
mmetsp:Transcript_23726/g.47631  ORF Transcript_23726/g.47631 Transcript_23726/m.47631 type:complete len:277 (+) Transcript_23726:3-833(+)